MDRQKKYKQTLEQLNYYNEITGKTKAIFKKVNVQKQAIKESPTSIPEYVDNCFWWINEYFDGRCSKDHFVKALHSLIGLANKLPDIFKPIDTK